MDDKQQHMGLGYQFLPSARELPGGGVMGNAELMADIVKGLQAYAAVNGLYAPQVARNPIITPSVGLRAGGFDANVQPTPMGPRYGIQYSKQF
jgi:hypothetical protein